MRVVLAAHTAALREAALEAARHLQRDDPRCTVTVVDLATPVRGSTTAVDHDGVLHLPADPALPVAATAALAQAARLAEWLSAYPPDVALLPADAGLAHFALLQREQGLVPVTSRYGCLLLSAPELEAARRSAWLTEPVVLERATTTAAALSVADLLIVAPDAATVTFARDDWSVPPDTRRPAVVNAAVLEAAVRDLIRHPRREMPPEPAEADAPRISVCVIHRDRPELLRQALSTVAAQTYPHVEVIVVDDGSERPETLAALDAMAPWMVRRGWRLLREPNRFPGAARNTAARHATGTHLLFLDDDDGLTVESLATLARAAVHTGADVVSAFADYFEGSQAPTAPAPIHHRWIVSGPCGAQSLLQNDFGVVTALVRRDAFDAVGGFREQEGVGFEDWELYLALYTAGCRFTVVPRPLFRIRWSAAGRMAESAARRIQSHTDALRPVAGAMPAAWRELPALAVGLHMQNRQLRQQIATLEAELTAARRAAAAPPAGPAPALPMRVSRGQMPATRCHVWHTEGLGLSGILSWMWRLRTQFGPATDVTVRLVDLALHPYGFQQAGTDPATLYDERIDSPQMFLDFLQRTANDVHVINHAFEYVASLVRQFGADMVRTFRLVGVCHTDQEFYYEHLARLAPVLRSIVCVSDTCARELAARIPEHAAKLVLLPAWAVELPPHPVPTRPAGTPLRLLYTGRIVQYQKRVLDLARLALELRRARVDATITIVGDGPDLPALQQALATVRSHAVPVQVEPVRAPWEMEPLLRSHDALVQVSEFEGASVSLMEALAHGLLPVVTTTRSGHDLLVPDDNAVTAPVGEMRVLAEAIAGVAADPCRLARLQHNARSTAERYLAALAYPERFAGLVQHVASDGAVPEAHVA